MLRRCDEIWQSAQRQQAGGDSAADDAAPGEQCTRGQDHLSFAHLQRQLFQQQALAEHASKVCPCTVLPINPTACWVRATCFQAVHMLPGSLLHVWLGPQPLHIHPATVHSAGRATFPDFVNIAAWHVRCACRCWSSGRQRCKPQLPPCNRASYIWSRALSLDPCQQQACLPSTAVAMKQWLRSKRSCSSGRYALLRSVDAAKLPERQRHRSCVMLFH